jgi:menaquinone-dependent protoporphyrinogen oxidase
MTTMKPHTKLLVATASKHGSTHEIGVHIASTISKFAPTIATETADVHAINEGSQELTLGEYDAIVIGSPVYYGHWLDDARKFVDRHAAVLARVPVWLFSAGPLGDPPRPAENTIDASEEMERTHARDHVVFSGVLDRERLGFGERAVVLALHAADGDFRDWARIDEWATKIASELTTEVTAGYDEKSRVMP